MSNMLRTIVPKSDQLNADDLIGRTLTIKVTEVRIKGDGQAKDQPVSIYFDGDNGKPYKPSMSMRRVLVHAWGGDGNLYVGRSITLYRDPAIKWAGEPVGGIAISHLSHIEKRFTIALTETRGKRKQHTVEVLEVAQATPSTPRPTAAEYETCNGEQYKLLESRRKQHWGTLLKPERDELEAAKKAAFDRLAAAAAKPQSSAGPTFDAAKSLEELKRPTSRQTLDSTWNAVVDHFTALDKEVPVEYDAAYQISKESFAE